MYCSMCGHRLPHPAPVQCPGCGIRHWRNPLPCADALVVREGRLLMVRHARGEAAGLWDIPGGFCDAGEHPIETILRTVPEETGLAVAVTGYLGAWRDTFPRSEGRPERVQTLGFCYHAVPVEGEEPCPDPVVVSEAGWFPPDRLPGELASPDYLSPVLAAWRDALLGGRTVTPLPDRPLP
jgi:8-oxo-dGTP diphosphatase